MTDSWEDAVPAAPLAAVSLKDDAPAPAAANNDDDDWFADQRRNTDKAEKRERKAGAPKILKRVSSKGELPTKPQRRSPTQTDAEREQAYAAARARIFAEEAAAPAPVSKKKGGADWASALCRRPRGRRPRKIFARQHRRRRPVLIPMWRAARPGPASTRRLGNGRARTLGEVLNRASSDGRLTVE